MNDAGVTQLIQNMGSLDSEIEQMNTFGCMFVQ
jgi:hypothetical protein